MRRPVGPSGPGRSRNAPRLRAVGHLGTSSWGSVTRMCVRVAIISKCGACIARRCLFAPSFAAERLGDSSLRPERFALIQPRCSMASVVRVYLVFLRCRNGLTLHTFLLDLPSEWSTKISIAPSSSRKRRDSFRRRRFSHPRTNKHVRPTALTH